MKNLLKSLVVMVVLCLPWATEAQVNYSCNFENAADTTGWVLLNGTSTNKWVIGSAASHGGTQGLYISNDEGSTNAYTLSGATVVYAYRDITLSAGTYDISFDWRAYGESTYDYIRVALIPATTTLAVSTTVPTGLSATALPTGWIALDGGSKLNLNDGWLFHVGSASITTAGTYHLAFVWRNDGSGGAQPPAAIDNIQFKTRTCPFPTQLTASNITAHTATLSWTQSGSATQWIVEYADSAFTFGTGEGTRVVASATTLPLTGLNANKDYYFYVQAVNSSNDSSMAACGSFRTACESLSYADLPWTEDFESYESGTTATASEFPDCWNYLITSTSTTTPFVYNSSSYAHSGTNSLRIYATGLYCLPPVAVSVDSLTLTLWTRHTSATALLIVGVMTNPNDATTFVAVDTIDYAGTTASEYHEVSFANYSGNGHYIAFKNVYGTYTYSTHYIDDLELMVTPTCWRPTAASANPTDYTATLYWTADSRSASAPQYAIDYRELADSNGSYTTVYATADSVILTGLTPNTEYIARIRAICGAGDTSYAREVTFTTQCQYLSYADMPWTEDFESYAGATTGASGIYPECWSYIVTASSTYQTTTYAPIVYNNTTYAHSGTNSLRLYAMGYYSLPPVAISVDSLTLTFYSYRSSSSYSLIVGVMTDPDDASTFVPVDTINYANNSVSEYHEVSFANYTGNGHNIAFRNTYNSNNTYSYHYIDDLELMVTPTCWRPTAASAVSLADDEAILYWTADSRSASASHYVVDYIVSDDSTATWATEYAAADSVVLTGLQPNTEYTAYIRTICGAGDTSYAQVIDFRTACSPIATADLPYHESFESWTTGVSGNDDSWHNSCWGAFSDYVGTNHYPYVMSGTASDSSKSLYLYKPTSNYAYVTLPRFEDATSTLMLSADWYCSGSSASTHYYAVVGVMTNPYDTATFVPVDTIETRVRSTWETIPVFFNNYTGNDGYITVMLPAGSSNNLYMDNLTVQTISDCPVVTHLHTTLVTADTIALAWTENGSSTSWTVEYATDTITPGMGEGTTVSVSGTPAVILDGLSSVTLYYIYVYPDCSSDDYVMLSVRTDCGTLTVPYVEDFEAYSTGSGNYPACWVRGGYSSYPYVATYGGSKSLYMYTNKTNKVYASLPPLDTVASPINTLQLTFSAMKTSSSASSSTTTYSSNLVIGVCDTAGDLSTFTPIDTITDIPYGAMSHYVVNLNHFNGSGAYVTFVSDVLGATTTNAYNYVAIDNVSLHLIPDCPDVLGVTAEASVNAITVGWDSIDNATSWNIVIDTMAYTAAMLAEANYTQVYDNPATLSGLEENTLYYIYVQTECSGSTSGWSEGISVRTLIGCDDSLTAVRAVCGDGTASTTNVPASGNYGSSYTQQIYTADDLESLGIYPGYINTISINWTANNESKPKHLTIYMANTTRATYDGTAAGNWVPLTAFHQVWQDSNNVHPTGWVDYVLDTAFYYDGHNLCVAFLSNHNGTNTNTATNGATYTTQDEYRVAYLRKDNLILTPDTAVTLALTRAYTRNNMRFSACVDVPDCPRPRRIQVDDIADHTATLRWTNSAEGVTTQVEYGVDGFAQGTGVVLTTTADSCVLTGLTPLTTYDVYLRALCSAGDSSNTNTVSFTTLCGNIESLPFTEDFNNCGTGTSVHAPSDCWNNGYTGSGTSYPYVTTSSSVSDNPFLYLYCYRSSSYPNAIDYVTLPMVDSSIAINQTQLVLDVSRYSSTTSYADPIIVVGVTTTPGNFDTAHFTAIDTIIVPAYGAWETFEVPFDAYTGQGRYVTFYSYAPITTGTTASGYAVVDNLRLETAPSCRRVTNISYSNLTANSVTLDWDDHSAAQQWVVEYGAPGFTLGSGTQVAVSQHPAVINNLVPQTDYEVNVRTVCTAADSSLYAFRSLTFTTMQIPATVPYHYDFEDATEFANWGVNTNNDSISWYRGSAVADQGTYAMYISPDSGATYATHNNQRVNAAAYRDIDFGTSDTNFVMRFHAKAGGTTDANYDGLMLFLVDPAVAVEASDANITSPWGNVNDLQSYCTVRRDTVWDTYEVAFDTLSGVHRVAFFWFNQNTPTHPYIGGPAAVDDIHIDYAPCARPMFLMCEGKTNSTASLSWQGSSDRYIVYYRSYGDSYGPLQTATTNTNSILLTGLSDYTRYVWAVRGVCGADTSLLSDSELFMTEICSSTFWVGNYDTTTTVNDTVTAYVPGNSYYKYSFTQVIIDSADLVSLESDISGFAFNPTNTVGGDYYTNCDVYLKNVTDTALTSGFLTVDSSWTLVMSNGDLCFDQTGWHAVRFDTTFVWDGSSNLCLAINRKHGSWVKGQNFKAHTTAVAKARYINADGSAYDVANPGVGTASLLCPDIRLISCGSCVAPVASVSTLSYDEATITWMADADNYEVAIKAQSDATWPAATTVSANSYTFTGLQPATAYLYQVRQQCDSATVSDWYVGNFVTDSLPCMAPTALTAQPQGQSATLSWTVGGEESAWTLHVFNTTFDHNYAVTTNPYTVTGLTAGVTYHAAIAAVCGNGAVQSDYSDTISFTTVECDVVSGLTVSAITGNSAVVSWTPGANNTGAWEVEYGYHGYAQGEALGTYQTSEPTYTLTALAGETHYDVTVRAVCATGYYSNNVQTDFTTATSGIDAVNGSATLTLAPNPAAGSTTVTLSGVTGTVTIAVIDMSGRTLRTFTMECDGDCSQRLLLDDLSAGAYFVRLSGNGVNQVKKLIVK